MGSLPLAALRGLSGLSQAVAVWLRGRCQVSFSVAAGLAAAQGDDGVGAGDGPVHP